MKEILIIAAAAQDLSGEVGMHTEGALNQDWSRGETVESIVTLCPYIGFPKTNHAAQIGKKVFDKREESA